MGAVYLLASAMNQEQFDNLPRGQEFNLAIDGPPPKNTLVQLKHDGVFIDAHYQTRRLGDERMWMDRNWYLIAYAEDSDVYRKL